MIDKLKYWLIMALMVLPHMLAAAPVDADAARAILGRYLKNARQGILQAESVEWELAHTELSQQDSRYADYYVFNASDGSAFVVVAGDDRMDEVLAWGDGELDMDKAPDGLLWLLDSYRQQAEYLHANADFSPSPRVTSGDDTYVAPLLSSQWGQRTPYRDQCPTIDGKNCVTGCVATSMAQVMYYWKYPSELPELPAYITSTNKIHVPELPSVVVDWQNMIDKYRQDNYTEAQGEAVAQLMRYCGQAAKMDYGIASSAAWIEDQLTAIKLFDYNSRAKSVYRALYSDEEWELMMRDELTLGCPIIYSGSGSGTSHNFIVDGCDGSKYHINWGWDGYNDGFFEFGAFSVFNDNQVMLNGVRPEADSVYEFSVDGIYYSKTSNHTVMVTYASSQSNNYQGVISIPPVVNYSGVDYDVNEIGIKAFAGSVELREVIIPSSVTSVGSRAFEGCSGLQRVEFSNSVTRIGTQLFYGCTNLASVVLPDGLTTLGSGLFSNCRSLIDVTLPSALTSIGPKTFQGCTSLSAISIPEGVTKIEDGAFSGCSSLSGVTIPEVVRSIGKLAFKRCSSLDRIAIPGSVVSIGADAFDGCTSLVRVDAADLTSWCGMIFANEWANPSRLASCLYVDGIEVKNLVIPEGVTKISDYAFMHNLPLVSVAMPQSLARVGQQAFDGCDNLTRVDAANVSGWCGIKFADISANPLTIAKHLFVDGQEVIDLDIPNGCTSIGDYAFNNATSLVSAMIPSTMTAIGKQAFGGTTFGEIFCLAPNPPALGDAQAFSTADYQNAFLRVPGMSRELYRNDQMWGQFVNVLPVKPDFEHDGFTYSHLEDGCVEISYVKPSILDSLLVIPSEFDHEGNHYTVTGIGGGVFYGRDMIVEVDIPATIKHIGEDAFKGCTRLKRVNLHDIAAWCGVELANTYSNPITVAGQMALNGTVSESLVIPEGVTSVSARAFDGCNQLHYLYLPTSMGFVGSRAFAGAVNIWDIFCLAIEPPDMENADAFANYYNPRLHVLERSLNAFQNHEVWKRFSKKETIAYDFEQDGMMYSLMEEDNTLVSLSFSMPTSDAEVVIPATVVHDGVQYTVAVIGPEAFKNRGDVVAVDIPATVTTIGQDAFRGCDNLQRVNIHDVLAWSQVDIAGNYASPLYYAHHLYLDGNEVTEVILPDTITRVGSYAFSSCYGLKIVDLGEGVKTIGPGAFRACLYMDSLIIGSAVREIGASAFGGCRALRRVNVNDPSMWALIRFADEWSNPFCEHQAMMYSHGEWVYAVEIPDTVTAINDYAFYGCYALFYIAIPPSVKRIGADAFNYCYYLQRVYIQDVAAWCQIDFSNLNSYPFANSYLWLNQDGIPCDLYVNDELVTDLFIPSSVREVPNWAFGGFSGLKSVKLGSGVNKIGDNAFYYCTGLETVDFGHTLKTIGNNAFGNCYSLDNVVVPNSVTSLQEAAFVWCKSMKSIQLPRTLKRVNASLCGACQSLEEVVIPNQVTYVGPGSFNYCYNLKRVTIGSSVDTIASERNRITFSQCNSLEEVICLAKVPPVLYHDAFDAKGYSTATLYVPVGSLEAYQTASEWNRFATIVGTEVEEEIYGDVNGDGEVNILDVDAVINVILGNTDGGNCDVNGDNEVNILDVDAIINVILGQ